MIKNRKEDEEEHQQQQDHEEQEKWEQETPLTWFCLEFPKVAMSCSWFTSESVQPILFCYMCITEKSFPDWCLMNIVVNCL